MRISVNLASRPFVELRPLFARLRLGIVALSLLAFGLGFGIRSLSSKARLATAHMDALTAQTGSFQQQRQRNEARMRQPQNQAVLARSQFLNALFARKSFSWTAVMMDLERVLPPGVQVTSIEPVISKEGDVSIRLRVSGERDRAIQLVRNLERSQRFVSPRIGGETSLTADKAKALGQTTGNAPGALLPVGDSLVSGVEFEIFSGYNPLPAATAAAAHQDNAVIGQEKLAGKQLVGKQLFGKQPGGKPAKPSPDDVTGGAR